MKKNEKKKQNNYDENRNNNLICISSEQKTKRTYANDTQQQMCKHTVKQTTHTKHHDIPKQTHETHNSHTKHIIQRTKH